MTQCTCCGPPALTKMTASRARASADISLGAPARRSCHAPSHGTEALDTTMHKEWSFPLVFHQRHHIPNMRGHSGICGLPLADGKHLVRHHAPTAFPLRRATSQAKGWTERPVRMSDRLIEHPSERVGCRTHSSVECASTHQSGWAAGHTAAWSVRAPIRAGGLQDTQQRGACVAHASIMLRCTTPRSHGPCDPHTPHTVPTVPACCPQLPE